MFWKYLKFSLGFWWGFGWSVAGVALVALSVFMWTRYFATRNDYYEAYGRIVEKTHLGRSQDPHLVVGYLARDGSAQHVNVRASRADFDQYALGGEVLLYVSGVDPTDAWAETDGPRTAFLPWVVTAFTLIFAVPGPIVFVRSFRVAATRARTLATGQLVTGKVLDVEDSSLTINKVRWQTYRVQWRGLDNQDHETTTLPFPPDKVRYDAGDPMPVYVDASDPALGEPDPDGMRS